jgi:hypothetical protein
MCGGSTSPTMVQTPSSTLESNRGHRHITDGKKNPTRLLTNPPPPVPKKKKKKKKKRTRFEPVCVCVAGKARANGQTVRKVDVCIASLTQFEKTFATGCVSPIQTNDSGPRLGQTNKHTNKQTDPQTRQGHLATPAVYRAVD